MTKPYSLKMRDKILLIFCLLVIGSFTLFAQNANYTLSGQVVDASTQAPLPGALIKVLGTNFATSTSIDGKYQLNFSAPRGSLQVQFSSVGYKARSLSLEAGATVALKLDAALGADLVGLDEVIVTGTSQGTTRKAMGSYISSMKGDDINKSPSGNVLSALQGKAAGAQISQNSGDPAGGMSVRLRGISSVNSSSEPLYIIDGVIVNNNTTRVTNTSSNYDGGNFVGSIGQNRMVDINPADIERIEILNGAAAAAIYGSRANAGVIQIFTKKGVAGKTQINFNTTFTHSKLRKQIEVNQSPTKFGGSVDAETQDVLIPALTTKTNVNRYNYQDYIFQTALGTDNNISVAGGGERTKFYTSAAYFRNQGIVKNTNFTRYNFRTNIDQKINDWASISAGINYVKSQANEKPDGNSFFSPMNSVTIIGNFHDIFRRDGNGNLMAVGERGRVNPVSVIEDIKQKQESSRIISNARLKLSPLKNFSIDLTLGVDNTSQNGTTYIPPFTYNVNPDFYGGGVNLDAALNGYASAASNQSFMFNDEINLTYQAQISENLASTTQLGYSYQYEKNRYALLHGRGLAPIIETVNAAATPLAGVDGRSELSISGGYLQQNFNYKDHLFLTAAVRMDESSVFGKDYRNQVYLKGSISYVLSSAEYWKSWGVESWWNTFKLRAAIGESGNLTGIGAYDRINAYSTQPFLGRASLFSSAQLANENIKPERQREIEFGVDAGFLNNRLNLSVNYYNKKVSDLLFPRVIAPSSGFTSLLDNIGALRNKGVEFVISGQPIKNDAFAWNASFILNRNRNEALDVGGLRLLSTNPGAPVAIINGEAVGVFYGTFFARNADGSLLTNAAGIPQIERGVQTSPTSYEPKRDANGMPTGTTLRKVLGNPNPKYTWTFVNDFTYKKLSLHVQLDAVRGTEVWNADWRTRQGVGGGKVAEQEQMGLLPRGYVSGVYAIEEWRIDDGSFVKLREVSLSYSLGQIKNLRDLTIVLSGRNLISWDNYKGYDPELNSGGQSTILRNIDFGSVPIPRTFSLGLQVKF